MDCKTARLLLDFHRPQAGELDDAEAAALEEHLAGCPDCESVAHAERRIDNALGQAMRQVEVPDRLRIRLLTRLAANHSERQRRRIGRLVPFAAAAALLLVAAAGYSWWMNRLTVDPGRLEAFWEQMKADKFSPPDAEGVREKFKKMGVDVVPPRNFCYNYLTAYGLGEFEGKHVPQLVFVREGNAAYAQVLILSPRQFNVKLNGDWQSEEGYPYRVRAVRYPGLPQVYVIFHTGDDFDWLEKPDEAAQTRGAAGSS